MKGAIEFFLDFLVTHPNGKWLVTNPSTSPENFPAREGNGRYFDETTGSYLPGTSICAGSAIDMQILNDLFGYFTAAADILGRDDELKSRTISARERLVPPLVGSDSLLQEWTDDWGQTEKPHRHLSHLYGLYPGNVLSPLKTPGLIDPVKRVLEQRTDGSAGWSRPWKMACWARLYDGNRALKILKQSMQEQTLIQLFSLCYTAMQVDASLGNSAAISEMLLQSHDGFIHLLPALPAEWDEGEISGIRARGGFEISMSWKAGRPVSADLISHAGENLRIKTAGDFRVISEGRQLRTKKLPGGITEVATIKNKRYSLKFL
jgi:alpha-L-fucosidase 2